MTLEKLLELIADRLDGYGLVVYDMAQLRERIENQATNDEVFDYKDCHLAECQHVD